MMIDEQLFSRARAAFGRTWRGEIWEDDPDVPMGAGYSNDGKPFDIETAAYLKPVMRALRDPNVRKVVCLAAVQTLKTFGCIEKPASYFIKHAPGDMALYDCSGDASDDHAKSRFMPYLLGVPAIKAATEAVAAVNRHRITQTEFYLPSMTLRVWPLNENSTQRVTLKYVFISDAFLSGRSGLIGQAIARTTQHPHDCKIVIESQGGEVGDDLDLEWDGTDQRLLHVVCPFCEMNQPFLWGLNSERFRPPEFQPVTPKRYTLGYAELEIGWPLPKPLTHAGMIRGDAKYNRSAHEIIEDAVLNETYYECYHCGAHWLDVPDVRRRLDHSSNFVPQKKSGARSMASTTAANEAEQCSAFQPPSVGFTWPMWINQRLRWGSEKEGGMLAYLKAIKFDRERGNREPYKQWIQKRAARMWHDTFGLQAVRMSDVVYDPNAPVPDGCKNVCVIDCQLELTHFWVQIWRVDRDANLRLLWQEHVQPPGELISVAERRAFCQKRIEDKIKEYKVQPHHVAIDARHKPDLVLQWVGRNYFYGDLQMPSGKIKRGCFMTWCMLMGDKRRTWNWTLPNKQRVTRRYSEGIPMEVRVRHQGREWTLKPLLQHWSNWHIKNIADRFWRQDNAPRVEVPPQYMAEQGPESLREQMQSECVHPGKGRGGLPYWDKRHSGVFNHYWDTFCQLIVMLDKFGLLDDARMPLVAEEGEAATTEETANPEHSTANAE